MELEDFCLLGKMENQFFSHLVEKKVMKYYLLRVVMVFIGLQMQIIGI